MNGVLRHLRRAALLAGADALGDRQLLDAFLAGRDEAAFEALLRRHGPMVLGVCRRVLRDPNDAEDAFQATFLVLLRKAGSLRSRDLLAPWLYGVAYRTALKARATTMKRRTKEQQAAGRGRPEPGPGPSPELVEQLDRALHRLPAKYRTPVVLCELEGKSRKEAAGLLGLPEGTLSWRLAQAKKMLARSLGRPGAPLTGAALAALLAGGATRAALAPALVTRTARAVALAAAGRALTAGVVSARVLMLTEGVMKTMLLAKLRAVVVVLMAVSVAGGLTGMTYRAVAAPPAAADGSAAGSGTGPAADDLEALRLEVEALRKSLQATQKRVKSLEGEVATLKGSGATPRAADTLKRRAEERRHLGEELKQYKLQTRRGLMEMIPLEKMEALRAAKIAAGVAEAMTEVQAALKKYLADPDDPKASEALDQALLRFKARRTEAKPKPAPKKE